ncbi:MAG: class II glutamine amidotransferase [Pseudomonadota bacterium]|nr:class II glutamine amidotransferase [Pseudomonadota bacterium]
MCRLAAYFGQPLFLEELIAKPRHSLMQQSLHADRAKVQTNGDGFGIGWYGDREEPGVYREVMPAWSDDNLLALSQTLRSRLFFAHVRAATTGGISRHNCHPFRHGRHLFMHNGQIGGYGQVRRTIESWLPDTLYAARRGATDSELLFLLALARLEEGLDLADAMRSVLAQTAALMQERGVEAALRFAAVLSDGEQLIAFRVSTDAQPPSLYLKQNESGTTVASEPLCDAEPGWTALPAGAVVTVDAQGTRVGDFSLSRVAVAS